ncbi:Hypothetical protein R9X50_00166600 [Acrodontium crateriforme]|uniref:Uncharacterized protein n=1 Tax=Acrodontium crateriforme TaxID=150365 RepID=A0AAQ3LZW0_9PEZI|nr:Hypothetical protein R9X50_00166600 [Acrodontium crateriforme]
MSESRRSVSRLTVAPHCTRPRPIMRSSSIFCLPPELLSSSSSALFNPRSVKRTLSSINREVGFIARTLGRLRHKHHLSHFVAQCSPDPQTPLQEQDPVSFVINRVLGRNATFEPVEDLESAPASPMPSSTSSCSDDDDDEWAWPTPSLQTSWPELENHNAKQPPPQLQFPAWEEPEDIVHVTVDARCPTTFTVPSSTITTPPTSPCPSLTASTTSLVDPFVTSTTTTTTSSTRPILNRHNRATSLPTTLFLPDTSAAQFHDFARWLRTSRILPYTPQGSEAPQWAVEDAARRLRDAFRLAYELGSEDYGKAAVAEFKELGEFGRGALGW